MTIAIILSTHGCAAEQLLKTTEMIIKKKKNIESVHLLPGENTDTLIKKYNNHLLNLNLNSGILFLVDTWGGTPFNAAVRITKNYKKCDIITGVNIPMLIELLITRDDSNISFEELTQISLDSGRSSIKSIKFSSKNLKSFDKENKTKNKKTIFTTKKQTFSSNSNNNHMIICLARIDDRLIHGQVVTRWTKEYNVKRIIVVNDDVYQDSVRKTLLTQVAPPGITSHVVNINKAIRVYNNPKYSGEKVMMLFTNPTDVLRLIENDVPISSINIGGMAFYQNKKQITDSISVNKKDIEAFKKLNQLGIKLEVQKVPTDPKLDILDLIKKVNK